MDALGNRRDFFASELTSRVARHHGHVGLEPAVVRAAREDHLAADVPEAGFVLRGANGCLHGRRLERRGPRAEVVAMAGDAGGEPVGHLGRERRCHRVGDRIGAAGGPAVARVGGERLRRGHFRRRVREPLGVHLMLVDRLAAVERAAARIERRVQRRAGGTEDRRDLVGHAGI